MTSALTENDLTPVMMVQSSKSFDQLMSKLNTLSIENASLSDQLMKKQTELNNANKELHTLFVMLSKQLKHTEATFENNEDALSHEHLKDTIRALEHLQKVFRVSDAGYIKRMKERVSALPFSF